MKRRRSVQGLAALTATLVTTALVGASTAEKSASRPGRAIFTTCAGCHGDFGRGRETMHAPNLTGQDAGYLIRQLEYFRTGKRGKIEDLHGFQMVGRANAIPDPQGVVAAVSFIGELTEKPAAPSARRSVPKKIVDLVPQCIACHGAAGAGNPSLQAPALNRLDAPYIVRQLNNFRSGIRGYDPADAPGARMAAAARALPDREAIDLLAAYFAGQ